MSSNDIDYDSDKSIDFSNEELMFKMNDIDVESIDVVDNSQEQITNDYNNMTKEELLDYIKKDKLGKKSTLKNIKRQQTDE